MTSRGDRIGTREATSDEIGSREAKQILRVHFRTLSRLCETGQLPHWRNRHDFLRFRRRDVEQLARRRAQATVQPKPDPKPDVPAQRSPRHRPMPSQVRQPGVVSQENGRVLIQINCPPHVNPDDYLAARGIRGGDRRA